MLDTEHARFVERVPLILSDSPEDWERAVRQHLRLESIIDGEQS